MAQQLQVGDSIPSFELPNQEGNTVHINTYKGRPLVIYFYPKDNTPGCTAEACAFRDAYEDFKAVGAEVIGISSDDAATHGKFAAKHRLPFVLLSDKGGKVRKQFGVSGSLFGLLPGRVTFVCDGTGKIIHTFTSQFNATKHVEEAIAKIQTLNTSN